MYWGYKMDQLTVLGKYGPYAKEGSGTSAYLLLMGGKKMLLDCGTGALRALGESILELDCLILSHLHPDHVCDVLLLEQSLRMLDPDHKLDVYLPKTDGPVYDLIGSLDAFSIIPLTGETEFVRGDVSFKMIPLSHPLLSYGVRICHKDKVFAYTGDTTVDDGLLPLLQGADLALMDAAFTEKTLPSPAAHLSALQAAKYAEKAGAKALLLTHVHPRGDEAAMASEAKREFCGPVSVVIEGAVYDF
ncbi:MAG: MBL fold metallo-hydrolase [Clostridiales bacterium]|nr:MBL fold metallo-hydrolase [Clostridiales bacterium]